MTPFTAPLANLYVISTVGARTIAPRAVGGNTLKLTSKVPAAIPRATCANCLVTSFDTVCGDVTNSAMCVNQKVVKIEITPCQDLWRVTVRRTARFC